MSDIIRLIGEWQASAKKHALAAVEGDCDIGDDEWCLHRESARIYRACADQLEAITPATIGVAQAVTNCGELDPPAKWLDEALRNLARELLADPKTPWIGDRDPKQHICWTAADRLLAYSLTSTHCAGGVDPGWDECPKCGATSDDACAVTSTSRDTP